MTVAAALGLASIGSVAAATEEPHCIVIEQHEDIEVRGYAPCLVSEVVVLGPADAAGNQGFRILAACILARTRGNAGFK
jgi:hypothetical protein